jgi:hypothetical protein
VLASRVLNRVLGAGGLELMPKWRVPRAPQTAYLRRLLDERRVDGVLDVAANRGQFRDYLREQVGYTGWIVSFVPHPSALRPARRRAPATTAGKCTQWPLALSPAGLVSTS